MPITIGRGPDHTFEEPLGLLSDCHRRIEHFLRTLTAIAAGPSTSLGTQRRAELDAALTYFAVAAPRHTADEEESLFPRLRAALALSEVEGLALSQVEGGPAAVVARLEHDHEEAAEHHAAVEAFG